MATPHEDYLLSGHVKNPSLLATTHKESVYNGTPHKECTYNDHPPHKDYLLSGVRVFKILIRWRLHSLSGAHVYLVVCGYLIRILHMSMPLSKYSSNGGGHYMSAIFMLGSII